MTLEQLNALPQQEFAATLAGIFEHSPWVAQRAAAARPFSSRAQLLKAMRAAVDAATLAEQLALIRSHPKLGARSPGHSLLTAASAREQHRAGLEACTPQQREHLDRLNAAYLERFGFPFVLAVRGHDPRSIIDTFERRLGNDREIERYTALRQIGAIAGYRLADMVAAPAEDEFLATIESLSRASV
jgi:OHCU decarboxylase